jgi:KipI family sensor histidine kinase inhibitor
MSPDAPQASVADCGDSAVQVIAVEGTAAGRWALVHGLAGRLRGDGFGLVPTYDRLLVEFDGLTTDHQQVRAAVRRGLAAIATGGTGAGRPRRFVVPVVYGGEHGPDLDLVAEQQGCTRGEIVAVHSGAEYVVRCLGSPAGAPMMDGPPFRLPVPRRGSPRPRVPAGAVAVAGRQAVVSAMPAPGGWAVLGRTPLRMLDIGAVPPAAYRPGDLLRFRSIDVAEWDRFAGTLLEPCDE